MWLEQCLRLFPDIIEQTTGRRQDLSQVELEVSKVRGESQVDTRTLEVIEDRSLWDYRDWWPRLSKLIDEPIELPPSLTGTEDKQKGISLLYERLHHIEVVSVVLRFWCPQEFGILSPPVMSLLNLPPAENHVDLYLRYLADLQEILSCCTGLKGVAEVDMALWSAAHLHVSKEYAVLTEEMKKDEHFQEIRLRNLFHGLQRHWKPTDRERLVLSRALLEDDHIAAAAIAARCFESIVRQIARRLNVLAGGPRLRQTEFSVLIDKLAKQPELRDLPLQKWKGYRDKAVHEIESPIAESEAAELVKGVEQLFRRLEQISCT